MNSEKTNTKVLQTRTNPLKDLVIGKKNCKRIPAISGMINRMNGASFHNWE